MDGNDALWWKGGHLRLRQCRHGPMLYNTRDVYIGRSLDLLGEFCEAETQLHQQLLKPGDVVVDAGANVGAYTVMFAKTVGPSGRVYAFEPQRLVFQMLCANVALNELNNVEAWPAGLGAAIGQRVAPEVSPVEDNNFGGISLHDEGPGEAVPITTIDNLALERCDLIKADVQGMERDVLIGAAGTIERLRPVLYIENDQRDRSSALIEQLFDMRYRLHWHVAPLYSPENFRGTADNPFGDTVCINMLGLPGEDGRPVDGLTAVRSPDDWWTKA